MANDLYEILGVSSEVESGAIKKAFRQIARECHPDVAGSEPAAAERFKQARKAYETLIDPVTRARYDRRGKSRVPRGGSFFDAFYKHVSTDYSEGTRSSSRPKAARRHRTGRSDPGNNLSLDDLFSDFGSSAGRKTQQRPPPNQPPRAVRGGDLTIRLDVPEGVAKKGGTVTAVYFRKQRADSWYPGSSEEGLVRVQDIADVRISPGCRDGERLREQGRGDAGPYGGQVGDLIVEIRHVRPAPKRATASTQPDATPQAKRSAPVEVPVDISIVEALLGGRIEVKTPTGTVRVFIPAGTHSGTKLRLNGPDGAITLLVLRIVANKSLDAESVMLIEQFNALNPWNPRSD